MPLRSPLVTLTHATDKACGSHRTRMHIWTEAIFVSADTARRVYVLVNDYTYVKPVYAARLAHLALTHRLGMHEPRHVPR